MAGRQLVGTCLQARSISRPVWERMGGTGPIPDAEPGPLGSARVLAAFERACALVTSGGVVALVLPEIGDGPLSVVVDGQVGCFAAVAPGTAVCLKGGRPHLGDLEIHLDGAVIWEPRPDWERLRPHREAIAARLPCLQALALAGAPPASLLALLCESTMGTTEPTPDVASVTLAAAREAAEALRVGWEGDLGRLQVGATRLAGLGCGLTPAGDDFLAGVMLWAWLAQPTPRSFCQALLKAAAARTTTLSAAFLRAAADGQCTAAWHRLLAALDGSAEDRLGSAVQDLLSHGSTSGADTLAGFLWLAHQRSICTGTWVGG